MTMPYVEPRNQVPATFGQSTLLGMWLYFSSVRRPRLCLLSLKPEDGVFDDQATGWRID